MPDFSQPPSKAKINRREREICQESRSDVFRSNLEGDAPSSPKNLELRNEEKRIEQLKSDPVPAFLVGGNLIGPDQDLMIAIDAGTFRLTCLDVSPTRVRFSIEGVREPLVVFRHEDR